MAKAVGQGVWLYFLFSFCMHIYPLICLALPMKYDNLNPGFLLDNMRAGVRGDISIHQ